ncbi:hypothetical protein BKA70DRAFT_1229811 [Coprinopsis sp. MPI-PUGE-AT-0042]|nr:hypothetical protein BKA70DRAFT_1229811 [Coprinopsis sp. MPI-PUGE-AT-0042]
MSHTTLPEPLLAQVRDGELHALRAFAAQIDHENYNLDALDAILHFFQRDPISFSLESHAKLLILFAALDSLRRLALASRHHPDLADATRTRMQANTKNLAAWIESGIPSAHLLALGGVEGAEKLLTCVANALAACLAVGGGFEVVLLNEPRTVRTMLKLWSSCLSQNSSKLADAIQEQGTSMIIAAMMMFIRLEAGQEGLADFFSRHPGKLKEFCEATNTRISQIPSLSRPEGMTFDISKAQRTLYMDIWQITKELSKRPLIFKALCDANTLTSWSNTLVTLSRGYNPLELFQLSSWLITRCLEVGGNPTLNLQCVLNSGYLSAVLQGASRCDPNDQKTDILTRYFISSLEPYTAYPRTILLLSRAVEFLMPEQRASVTKLPSVGEYWAYLFGGIAKRARELAVFEGGTTLLCDNKADNHSVNEDAKACSKCHLVAYCSPECQREDWRKRHRDECVGMQRTYQDRRNEGVIYSHKTRAFHHEIVKDIFRQHFQRLQEHIASQVSSKYVLMLDLRNTQTPAGEEITSIFQGTYFESRVPDTCAATEERVFQLLLRLPWTKARAIVLLMMVERKGGDFEVTRSVVQVLHITATGGEAV